MFRVRLSVLSAAALLAAMPLPAAGARAGEPPARSARAGPDSAAADSGSAAGSDTVRAGVEREEAERRFQEGQAFVEMGRKDLAAGRALMARKRFGKARSLFTRATQLDPRSPQAWSMLGFCARQCGDLNLALRAYGTCLEIAPEDEEAHAARARTYLDFGQFEKARAELAWLREHKSAQAESLAVEVAEAERGGARVRETEAGRGASPADSTRSEREPPGGP